MIDLTYLKQWSEPDGDNDQLFGVRMEVKSLIRAYEKSQRQLEAAKSVMWMAHTYAISGLSRPVMGVPDPIVEFNEAQKIIES